MAVCPLLVDPDDHPAPQLGRLPPDGEWRLESARADLLRRDRQDPQGARQAVGDPRGTGEAQHDSGAQRRHDPRPSARLESCRFRLRGQHGGLTGRRPGLEPRVHAFDQGAAFALREREGSRAPSRAQELLLARHDPAVRLEISQDVRKDGRGTRRHHVGT